MNVSKNPSLEIQSLLITVEKLRTELTIKVGQKTDLSDPEIIQASRKLDQILNEFYKLTLRLRL